MLPLPILDRIQLAEDHTERVLPNLHHRRREHAAPRLLRDGEHSVDGREGVLHLALNRLDRKLLLTNDGLWDEFESLDHVESDAVDELALVEDDGVEGSVHLGGRGEETGVGRVAEDDGDRAERDCVVESSTCGRIPRGLEREHRVEHVVVRPVGKVVGAVHARKVVKDDLGRRAHLATVRSGQLFVDMRLQCGREHGADRKALDPVVDVHVPGMRRGPSVVHPASR